METKNEASSERGDGKREAPKSLRSARMLKKQARSAM